MSLVPIKTERLILRDFISDDWQAVHEYASDPQVVKHVEWGPNTERDSRQFVQYVMSLNKTGPREAYELAVVLSSQDKLIGAASIHISNWRHREGWIGYCLNRQFWGMGIATEAGRSLVKFGFAELGLHRIFATVDPLNHGSAAVLKKLGMQKEGHFRENKFVRGKWRDTDFYAVLESEL